MIDPREWIKDGIILSSEGEASQVAQISVLNQYKMMKNCISASEMPKFKDVGFKVYSEFEEDGILLYIFSTIGTTNKKVVEIGCGDGIECMSANLIINHGWDGLLFDGNLDAINRGRNFYSNKAETRINPPSLEWVWITKDNINSLTGNKDFEGEIDLLSIDIDGNDYHILKELNIYRPRVIVCETHNVIPSNKALTIPYIETFNKKDFPKDYGGVSLLAMKNMLKEKGYRLVGSHKLGFNAFFIRDDIYSEILKEVSVESCHEGFYTKLKQKEWIKVECLDWIDLG